MGLIPNEIINAVLERSDIVTVVGRYVKLNKAGRNFKALCPFHHEKSPSFVVNPDKQIFHCFGCGAGGNAVGFVMRQERLEFPQAVRLLADQCGITIPEDAGDANSPSRELREAVFKVNELAVGYFHEHLLTGKDEAVKAAREYLKARGVSLEVVRKFSIGFAADAWDGLIEFLTSKNIALATMEQAGLIIAREGKKGFYDRFRNRIIFPIFDIQSRPVAFGARAMSETEGAKYINSPETPVYTKGLHMFGLNLTKTAAGQLDSVIVVEGYMDMIMPFIHGVENIAASLGTALTPQQIRLLRRYTSNVVMLFDTDPAGQNAIIRSLDLLVDEGMNVSVVTLEKGHDPDSFIRKNGAQQFRWHLERAKSLYHYKLGWLSAQFDKSTIEGRSKICRQMLNTINRFNDEVTKYELTRSLALEFNIPIDVLQKQAQQDAIPQSSLKSQTLKPTTQAVSGSKGSEEMLLALFLNDERFLHQAKECLSPADFFDPLISRILSIFWALNEAEGAFSTADLINRFSDDESQRLIAELASRDEKWLGDKELAFKDCVERIRKSRLHMQLEEAKLNGDAQLMGDLIRQIKN